MIKVLVSLLIGVGIAWLILIIGLLIVRPKGSLLKEALRLLPDLLRLLKRLATDRNLPLGVRLRLWLLMIYLAMPIDLIPDFLPVIGYADDAIVVAAVLRSVVRRAGMDVVESHWPGTPEGLDAVRRLCRLPARADDTTASHEGSVNTL